MYILYTQSIEIIFMSQRKNLNHVYPHIRSPSDPAHRALMYVRLILSHCCDSNHGGNKPQCYKTITA